MMPNLARCLLECVLCKTSNYKLFQNSGPIFRRLWKVHLCGSVRSLQRRFPIDDVLLRSGDILDQVAKLCKIEPKFWCFWATKFQGEGATQISDCIL